MNRPDHQAAPQGDWSFRLRVVGTILSVALLLWLLLRQEWDELIRNAASVPVGGLLAALILVFASQAFNTLRWQILIRAQRLSVGLAQAGRLVFAGLFASNFLPSTVGGDVVRVVGVLSGSESRVAGAATVVMDRLIGLFGMLFLLPFSWPLVSTASWFRAANGMVAASLLAPLPARLRSGLRRLMQNVRLWLDRPQALAASLLSSWAAVACYLSAVWLVAQGLHIPVSILDVAGVTAITYFLTLLPISINGYGLRELGMLALYVRLGASPEQATALAILTRALLVAVSLPGALWVGGILRDARQMHVADAMGEGGVL